jgi:hypothetical protein
LRLQEQINSLNTGIGTNWVTVPGSTNKTQPGLSPSGRRNSKYAF